MRTSPLPERGRLLISCPDRPGIVAAVSQFLFEHGANIVHSDQHSSDPSGGRFFMRLVFDVDELDARIDDLSRRFQTLADRFGMDWHVSPASREKRIAIFVSREEHCLLELLWEQRAGDLPATIALVVSNHDDLRPTVAAWGIPFHHIPVDGERRHDAEEQQLALLRGQVDVIVFARYMQVVSPEFVAQWPNLVINIHHGLLPAFVGAQPYHQAHERGVKLVGATAHYVTSELDSGPIIEQDIARVDHRHSIDELKRIGRHIERVVLARAVRWHAEDRVLVDGNKTVVFGS